MHQGKANIEDQKRITTEKYEIYLLEEQLVYVHYFKNNLIEEEDIEEAIRVGKELSPSDDTKLLIEVEKFVDFTAAAREYAQNKMRTLKAEAHVFPSLANRILFNFFIKLRKNDHPLKAFSKKEDALEWLAKV